MRQSGSELGAWINLSLIQGLRPAQFRALLSTFGLPSNVFTAGKGQLNRVVPEVMADAILAKDRTEQVEKTLQWVDQPGNKIITLADDIYPGQLLEIADPPPLLYVRGNHSLLSAPSIAIVGSRNATPQGLANAEQFARALSHSGLTIVSGLALGIDAAAHRGGLAGGGSTIAVIGTGADAIYPRGNTALGTEIASQGAMVSEFPLGTPPLAANFPRRNRLIAGLSRGVLVVEAALASGSLITARFAAEQGRDVFAIPGSIHSPVSKGCHALIKQGAKLVEAATDVTAELQGLPGPQPPSPRPHISRSEDKLLQHLGYDPCDIGTIAVRSGLTPEAVSAMLLKLELEGKLGSLPGGFYQRLV